MGFASTSILEVLNGGYAEPGLETAAGGNDGASTLILGGGRDIAKSAGKVILTGVLFTVLPRRTDL